MDNLFFGGFVDSNRMNWGFSAIINGLVDKETTYNIIYEAIIEHPTYVMLSEGDPERKKRILSNMIKHYEEREEYEKCYELLQIKKSILD